MQPQPARPPLSVYDAEVLRLRLLGEARLLLRAALVTEPCEDRRLAIAVAFERFDAARALFPASHH